MFGLMLIVFPLLLSKYKPLNYILTMKGFAVISSLMLPLMTLLPMVFIRYYYELHQLIILNYYQMFFYTIGSFILALPLSYLCFMFF